MSKKLPYKKIPRSTFSLAMRIDHKEFIRKKAVQSNVSVASYLESVIENIISSDSDHPIDNITDQVLSKEKLIKKRVVFICHAKEDKDHAIRLYNQLKKNDICPWLDENDLVPGQDWDREIKKVIEQCDVILILISNNSISKRGYVQTEIKKALNVADMIPEGYIYIIPVRIEDCVLPESIKKWHSFDLFKQDDFNKLIDAINKNT